MSITEAIADKLRKTLEIKNQLFEAIRNKGVNIPNPESFELYPQAVRSIKLADNTGFVTSALVAKSKYDRAQDQSELLVNFSSQLV